MVVGGAGSGGKRQAVEDETVPGRVCTAPQPPVRECRRSVLDHCFVYGITTTGWTLYPGKLNPLFVLEPSGLCLLLLPCAPMRICVLSNVNLNSLHGQAGPR